MEQKLKFKEQFEARKIASARGFMVQMSAEPKQILENEHRSYSSLDGIWSFVSEPANSDEIGLKNKWFLKKLSNFKNATVMPVPSAYNDIGVSETLHNHIGWVWYQRHFIETSRFNDTRHFLRFSSVNYFAKIFLNGEEVGEHVGGHLPFELEVTNLVKFDKVNVVTVAVNNTLSDRTIPTGKFEYKTKSTNTSYSYIQHSTNFDFFNYAGILRPVYLIRKSKTFIEDITIRAEYTGEFEYNVFVNKSSDSDNSTSVLVIMRNDDGVTVYKSNKFSDVEVIRNAKAWWPKDMGKPQLYTLEVYLFVNGIPNDAYRIPFGFRTISYTADNILINGRIFYCHGFGMHEDFELIGRGYSAVVMTKDLNMLEWMNGNCYRTSHYPYSEERAMEADRRGIAVITEVPAVGLRKYNKELETLHKQMLAEMIARDRNHPSIFMWSLANEPVSDTEASRAYFQYDSSVSETFFVLQKNFYDFLILILPNLVDFVKTMNTMLPITIVLSNLPESDKAGDLVDVICFNRYYGWYSNLGYLETIKDDVINEVQQWKNKYNKPVLISEYGAEALPGYSQEPSCVFSEQYQFELLEETHKAFDTLRKGNVLVGEMIITLISDISRPFGNHKGVLNRNRQPKMSAYLIKQRYLMLEMMSSSRKLSNI
uniref:Beta-glucuronidase n=1 Tax=Syphacia muris TaxID=451379 RepID=A0A0N5AN41_9BILA